MTKHDFSDRLGMDADVVFSYLVTPTEREMRKARTQIADMKRALVEKRAREQEHLDRVAEIGVMLDQLHRKMEEEGPEDSRPIYLDLYIIRCHLTHVRCLNRRNYLM